MKQAWPVIGFILLAFCLFAIFTDPEKAGNFVEAIFQGLADGLNAIGRFFNTILN